MVRRKNWDGRATDLQSLKRGDEVCISYWGGKYIKTKVTRVRTVECATIITVEKVKDIQHKRFVGYYTSSIATANESVVLTLDTYWGDMIETNLKSSEIRSKTIVTRARALKAMMDLKKWLFTEEDEFDDKDPE